ncbi:MAG: PAS domain S-box protein [Ignavibacteriales bacterium]|nr:PAS domain S-box protein [Ignavibacteriales bacterium]
MKTLKNKRLKLNRKKKDFLSYFIAVFTTLLMVIFVIVYLIRNYHKENELSLILKEDEIHIRAINDVFSTGFDNIVSDLEILSRTEILQNYLNEKTEKNFNQLNKQFLLFSSTKRIYDQIRFIDLNGMEISRVNFHKGNPQIVPSFELQNKSCRYYFAEAIKLSKGEIFVSPLDLNIENDKIENPVKPMIRFGTPVFNSKGEKKGIIILNYLAQNLLDEIDEHKSDSRFQLMLVNQDGYFLKSDVNENQWGFMYPDKKEMTFQNQFYNEWKKINNEINGQFETDNGIFTFTTIYPISQAFQSSTNSIDSHNQSKLALSNIDYKWKVVSFFSNDILNYYLNKHVFQTYSIPFVFLLISAAISLFTANIIVKRKNADEKRKRALRALKESEEQFRNLLNYTYSWEYWINTKGEIEYSSKSSESITGYKPEEFILNKNLISDIIIEEDRARFIDHNKYELECPNVHKFEIRIKNKKDEIVYIEHSCQPIYNDNGIFIGRRTSNRDITEQKRNEEIIRNNEKKLKEDNVNKDKFFSIISHDLKSPLSGLVVLSQMLVEERSEFSEEELNFSLQEINNALTNLHNLVEGLLSWSRVQTGRISFDPVLCSIKDLSESAINLSIVNARNKKIKIDNKICNDNKAFVDDVMIETVLRNLISNAIKFTDNGGIVTLSSKVSNDELLISVEDNGVGIKEDDLEKLFKIEEHITTPGTNKESGSGVGLILCKELVEKNDGRIWVESVKGKGSKFTFTLPMYKEIKIENKKFNTKRDVSKSFKEV